VFGKESQSCSVQHVIVKLVIEIASDCVSVS
jgi:hypothetical protein